MTINQRLYRLIALASVSSLVAASFLENAGALTSFVDNTPWLSDLFNLPADGMCMQKAYLIVEKLPLLFEFYFARARLGALV